MSKSDIKDKDAAVDEPVVATVFKLSLNEFCARLSVPLKKPELIAGFHRSERDSGNLEDTEANFQARFASFRNKPI